ncbi:hypothetical protein BsWGS_16450 [Bradybaena similaris]
MTTSVSGLSWLLCTEYHFLDVCICAMGDLPEGNKQVTAQELKTFRPLFDRVLIELLPGVKTDGNMLPEKCLGKVVAVGPGVLKADGTVVVSSVKVGDMVLLPDCGGRRFILENQEYFVCRDSDLFGMFGC